MRKNPEKDYMKNYEKYKNQQQQQKQYKETHT